jgi:hypothetical protein
MKLPAGGTPQGWKGDDWESARQRKFTLGLAATPRQRLAWLEEAIRLAWSVGALPRRSDQPAAHGKTSAGA